MVNLKKRKKGFTLIELIIVIAIIAILAAVTVPRLSGFRDDAKKKADIANAKIIGNAVESLIASGKINSNTTVTTTTTTEDGTTTITYDGVDIDTITVLDDYLQEVPTPKSLTGENEKFLVSISSINTNAKVYVIAKSDNTTGKSDGQTIPLYPSSVIPSDYK